MAALLAATLCLVNGELSLTSVHIVIIILPFMYFKSQVIIATDVDCDGTTKLLCRLFVVF